MQILSICLTKNEADILPRTIAAASSWSDFIIILDNGSTDNTSDVALDLERKYPGVIFFGTVLGEYSNGLRSLAYKRYAHLARRGDWWCRLDSDEIYLDDPRKFLTTVPFFYRSVVGIGLQFYFTEKDLVRYEKEPSDYKHGNAVGALRYFNCKSSEVRFFRHTGAHWGIFDRWPSWQSLLPIYGNAIRFKHYQFRFPCQIQARLDIRRPIGKLGKEFRHEARDSWQKSITGRGSEVDLSGQIDPEHWKSRMVKSSHLYNIEQSDSVKQAVQEVSPLPGVARQIAAYVVKKALNKPVQG